jgi:hypothetical protein
MLVWLGSGVLKVKGKYIGNGEEFDPEKVDSKTLDKLVADGKVGEREKVKTVKKKKDK